MIVLHGNDRLLNSVTFALENDFFKFEFLLTESHFLK